MATVKFSEDGLNDTLCNRRRPDFVRKTSTMSTIDNMENVRTWINEKSIKGIQERADSDLHRSRSVYDPILERERNMINDLDNFLSHQRLNRLRKKEMLHKKWNDRVYEPVTRQVDNIMNGPYYPDMKHVRDDEYANYLNHRNIFGHIFLDTYDEEQYDPMRVLKFDLEYDKNKVQYDAGADPLLSQQTFRRFEDQTIVRCETGKQTSAAEYEASKAPKLPMIPQGRHGIGSREWVKFSETDIDSQIRHESRKRMRGEARMLTGEYDHRQWDNPDDCTTSAQWASEKAAQYDNSRKSQPTV